MWDLVCELDSAQLLLHTVIEKAEVKLVVADEDFRMRWMSPAAATFLMRRPDEFVGRKGEELFPADLAAERRRINDEVLRTGTPRMVEETIVGWRCWTTVFPAGRARDGKRLLGVLIRPVMTDVSDHAMRSNGVAARLSGRELGPLATLSRTELRVLALIGQGLKTREIAERLQRAPKTIEGHRYQIGKKLGASNRVALALIAIRAGLAPLRPALDGSDPDHGSFDGDDDED